MQSNVDLNDVFLCLENDSACQPTTQGSVNCTIAGQMFTDSTSNVSYKSELAFTAVTWPGSPPPTGCANGPCIYPVGWNCTLGTTPPDYQVNVVKGGDYTDWPLNAKTVSWWSVSFCGRILLYGSPITPWLCDPDGFAWPTNINTTPPPKACTYNP